MTTSVDVLETTAAVTSKGLADPGLLPGLHVCKDVTSGFGTTTSNACCTSSEGGCSTELGS
eukprot:6885587-Prorocentrum_lima.AAC.1